MPKPSLDDIFSGNNLTGDILVDRQTQEKPSLDSIFSNDIETKPTKDIKALGEVGQFVGGIGGGIAGATVGHPYVGAALGGTAGRFIGELSNEHIKQLSNNFKNKDLAGTLLLLNPITAFPKTLSDMTNEEKTNLGKKTLIAGAVESALAPVGMALGWAGRGILKGLLGARVAERGFEGGFKKILDSEFFKNRVPKMIAEKTSKFFNRLSNTTGQQIDDLITKKYSGLTVATGDLKASINKLVPEGTKYKNIYGYIDDLATKSKVENTILKNETSKIMSMGGKSRKLATIWEQRKKLDKLINTKSWSDDGAEYLRGLRRALNEPIKSSGDDIAKAFNRYHFVKEGEHEIGKNFLVSRSAEGEIYASPAESFASSLMSTKKDELIRRLKDLDVLANADDKIIDKFLDYASAEALDKKLGMGVFQSIIVGMLGGGKTIAKIGAFGQLPLIKTGEKLIGRTVATKGSDIANE
jgi:hypothetical protein